MENKSKSAFRTIAEVAEEIGVATHVLRFWETKFPQISPMKTHGGRRYYRPDDVEIIKLIKTFLYEKRYTIEGVQKIFKEHGIKAFLRGDIQKDFFDQVPASEPESTPSAKIEQAALALAPEKIETLKSIKSELIDLKEGLASLLAD